MKKTYIILASVSLLAIGLFFGKQDSNLNTDYTIPVENDEQHLYTSEDVPLELINTTITFKTNTSAEDQSKISWEYFEWREHIILQNYNVTEAELDTSILNNQTFQKNLHISTIMAWGQYNGSLSEEELNNLYNQMEHHSVTLNWLNFYETSDERVDFEFKISVLSNAYLAHFFEARYVDIKFWSSDPDGKWHNWFWLPIIGWFEWYTTMKTYSPWLTDSNPWNFRSSSKTFHPNIPTGSLENGLRVWVQIDCILNGIEYVKDYIYTVNLFDDDKLGPIIRHNYQNGYYTDENPGEVYAWLSDLSGASFTSSNTFIVPNALGLHSYTFSAEDHDNDREGDSRTNSKTVTINIRDDDITPPVIGITVDSGEWSVTVNDPDSGVAEILVEVNGIQVGTAAGDYPIPTALGTHEIRVYAKNNDIDRGEIDQEDGEKTDTVISVNEGDEVDFSGIFDDPIPGIHMYAWDFGDGTSGAGMNPTHTYVDDGTYEAVFTVLDMLLEVVSTSTINVIVRNVAPVAFISANQIVDIGEIVSFVGSFEDSGVEDTHEYAWLFGDGTYILYPGTLTPTHTYAKDGMYTVALYVRDDDGSVGRATLNIFVRTIAPTVYAGPNQGAIESSPVSFNGLFFDPEIEDTHTFLWLFGDGHTATGTLTPTHEYGDNGVYTVTLIVTDDDGGVGSDTLTVWVNNVPPTVNAGPDQISDEGTKVFFDGDFGDPGADTWTIEWDFGDGTSESGTLFPSHTYADNGVYTVSLTVIDDDGGTDTDTLTITVNNVAPILSGVSATSVNEGSSTTLSGIITDSGILDPLTLTVDWGDGSLLETFNYPAGTILFSETHLYEDDNPSCTLSDAYTIEVTLEDDDLCSDTESLTMTVSNIAPSLSGVSATSVNEGSDSTLTGTISDPGILDIFWVTIDWGDGSLLETFDYAAGTTEFSEIHQYLDDNPSGTASDDYEIIVTIEDDDLGSDIESVTTTVSNVAPILLEVNPTSVNEGSSATLMGLIFDPCLSDIFTLTVDWGDGSIGTSTYAAGWFIESHLYEDDNPSGTPFDFYTVKLTIEDDDLGTSTVSTAVLVYNIAPTVDAGADQIVDEGTAVSFGGSFSDPGADAWTFQWDFGDNTALVHGTLTPSHTYVDNGVYTITLTVTDDDGGVGTETLTVTVLNVAPLVGAWPNQTTNEGTIVYVYGDFIDPGSDMWTFEWNFGDGSDLVFGTLSTTHTYADDGLYTVTLTVTDDDGGVGSEVLYVNVKNVAPTVNAGPDQTVDEGQPVSFSGSFSDPGADTHTYYWDFGEGAGFTELNTLYPQNHYEEDGTYTVTLRVTDDDGGVGTATVIVTVNNVAPTVDAGPYQTVDEGQPVSFSGSFSDPGADTHTYYWDFGEGAGFIELNTLYPQNHYEEDGTYTVTLRITDDDGGVGTDTLTVTVNNVAPTVDAGPDQTVDEGQIVSFSGSFSDPGADTHTYYWDFGEGAGFTELNTLHPQNHYEEDGTYTVTLRVTDDDGGVGIDTLTVTVNNVAPTAIAEPDHQAINEGDTAFFSGTCTDPGLYDTHTYTWIFGDGTPSSALDYHTYTDNGEYTVTLTVTDDDGGVGTDIVIVTVNNVAPTAIAGPDHQTINEGETAYFSAASSDPGGIYDPPSYMWDYGDGTPSSTLDHHTYTDNGEYTVTLTVTDDDGGVGTDIVIVTVNNVAPTVDVGSDRSVDEGQVVSFSGGFSDPGADTHTYYWDFGEGSGYIEMSTLTPTHDYDIPGFYIVYLKITDDDGGEDIDSLIITVKDITDPISTLTITPPYQETEETFFVSAITEFVLSAEDGDGFGVATILYQIDDGPLITHSGDLTTFFITAKGPHTIYYYSIDQSDNDEEVKSMDVIVNTCVLTYIGDVDGVYSDSVELQAKLNDNITGEPISGKEIVFTIDSDIVYAVTDINGVASFTLILDQIPDLYTVTASFEGDIEYLPSSDSSVFIIEKEFVYAEYTGDSVIPTIVDTFNLRATVFDEDDGNWGDLSKIYVNFTIYNENYVLIESYFEWVVFENGDGVGTAIMEINRPSIEGVYLVQISFNPDDNDYYWGQLSDFATLIIYEPVGDFVTGGGWIEDTEGNKGNFGFNIKYRKNGLPRGNAIYVYREGEYVYIIKANAWTGMAIIGDNNYSIFEAKCNVKQINATTGEIIWSEGNYMLRIEVWDHSQDGKDDVFQLTVYDKIGLIYHLAGFDPYGILGGGNIVIHIDEKK